MTGPVPRRRAQWGTITRDQVIAAATLAIRAGGYEQLTIRSLAADLGSAPMSLYRHVKDKDDLLDGVVEQLLSDPRSWRPLADERDWRHWVIEAAELLHRFLTDQPVALHVYLRHPVTFPAALTRMDTMLAVFRGSGLDDQQARRAYAAVHTYTVGFAALEASRANWTPPPGADATIEALAGFTSDAQFHAGLDFMLDGVEASVPRP
jgi:TetR/AcrR family tetracycline transcriptional repressor